MVSAETSPTLAGSTFKALEAAGVRSQDFSDLIRYASEAGVESVTFILAGWHTPRLNALQVSLHRALNKEATVFWGNYNSARHSGEQLLEARFTVTRRVSGNT